MKSLLIVMITMTATHLCFGQEAVIKDGPSIKHSTFEDFTFFNANDQPCSFNDHFWFRRTPEKDGGRYPFAGYHKNGSPYVSGFYSSLDSGGVRDGYFIYYDTLGSVIREGLYQHNRETGTWSFYYPGDQQVWYNIAFVGGRPVALTSYYLSGKIKRKQKYKYSAQETKFTGTCFDTMGKEIRFTPFEQFPELQKGKISVMEYLAKTVQYPPACRDSGIQGKVCVSFTVTETGAIDEVRVVRSVHPLLDQELIRLVKQMPAWKPARRDDKPLPVVFTLPMTFRLEGW